MKKIFNLLLCLLMICGCSASTDKIKHIQLNKNVTLSFFYIEDCSQCQAFKKDVIPLLEKTFENQITIHQYNLDDEETVSKYDPIIDSLQDFDEEYYGTGPFIVLDGYFSILGYDSGDEEYLIKDIENAVNDKELGYELEGRRFLFQESAK